MRTLSAKQKKALTKEWERLHNEEGIELNGRVCPGLISI